MLRWGFMVLYIYILSAFLSMGMQIASGYLIVNKETIMSEFFNTGNIIKEDVNKSIEATKEVAETAKKAAMTATTGMPQI